MGVCAYQRWVRCRANAILSLSCSLYCSTFRFKVKESLFDNMKSNEALEPEAANRLQLCVDTVCNALVWY